MSSILSEAVMRPRSPSPSQIRAARGLLNWSMADLAHAAQLSVATIKRMEMVSPQPVSAGAYALIKNALEKVGVRLLTDYGVGEGVWLDHVT